MSFFVYLPRALTYVILDAYSAYGKEGVVRALQILKDEMEMKSVHPSHILVRDFTDNSVCFSSLRLLGAPTLADVTPEMVGFLPFVCA